ncbi:DUF397 domain-containing protein [Streptomyces sp. CBMA152]|uniref:DUF397 domain-containing protein n=1 Tax=Streptomyces sp. CBMA152 TaxID=1896312 RepID=UPI0016607659|nr:DUF397 domain-containing protein [Streptomyces sp. CBMA152]MBD0742965.1 hypothetical protein [Streptomyces sp. CBMA152]
MTNTLDPYFTDSHWKKSSYSEGSGNACIETAVLTDQVGIRDSKDLTRRPIAVPTTAWSRFVDFITVDEVRP